MRSVREKFEKGKVRTGFRRQAVIIEGSGGKQRITFFASVFTLVRRYSGRSKGSRFFELDKPSC